MPWPGNVLTHRHSLVLHVDGGDAGSEEQGSPAGYPDSVKVSVILQGKWVGEENQMRLPPDPKLPLPQGTLSPHSILKQHPKDLTARPPHTQMRIIHAFVHRILCWVLRTTETMKVTV